jgi:putative peptidoglycan lipid II flippase
MSAQPEKTTLKKLGAAAALMTGAVFLSRVIGFLRESFVAARFGANGATDAFYAAFTIPDWLNYLLAGGTLSITFLPIYSKYLVDGDEREANRVLSVVGTFLLILLVTGVVVGEFYAHAIVRGFFHKMSPAALEDCARYTKILLPAQIFFFAGGLMSATLFARGKFAAAAFAPLLYNTGIIAGGWLLGRRLGVESLCWGALAGAILGPFLIPAVDAVRRGARFVPRFAFRSRGFIDWLKLTLPLMIGVSLVSADDWIIRYFAGDDQGAITKLNYAKRLVAVPIAVAGQAIGQASMPFFTRLFAEGKREELAATFTRTARSASVIALLIAGGMIGLAVPIVDLLFRRGRFTTAMVPPTAIYLAVFSAAVPLWTLQGLAARMFYSARNTLTPMIAGTLITGASIPLYMIAYRWWGPTGLAIASGVGILGHTAALIALAPRLLPELRATAGKELRGLGAGAFLATIAGAATWGMARAASALPLRGHARDLVVCAAGGAAFAVVVLVVSAPLGVMEVAVLRRKLLRR